MTAEFPRDEQQAFQMRLELEKIRRECPTFTAWIEQSVQETVDTVQDTDGVMLLKETGALKALRMISGIIASPPPPERAGMAQAMA